MDLSQLRTSHTVMISAGPDDLYTMVSDITRTGQWSPVNVGGQWDPGAGPWTGSWFTGRNRAGGREWTTRSQVTAASPGQEFAFVVGGVSDGWVRWGYTFEPTADGTSVTESWEVLRIVPHMGQTDDELLNLRDRTQANLQATLQALKMVTEGDDPMHGQSSPTQ